MGACSSSDAKEYDREYYDEKKLKEYYEAREAYEKSPEGLAEAAEARAKWESDEKILATIPEKERYWYATYVLKRPRPMSYCTSDVVPGPGPAY